MNYLIVMPILTDIPDQSYYFPLGMGYVSSCFKKTGRNVFTFNLNYKQGTIEENLKEVITKNKIDVIATGGLTAHYWQIVKILTAAKKINPQIITWVGGGIITSDPINAMKALDIADYGMIGEGEVTICELAEAVEGKRDFESVNGIIYKKDSEYVITNSREEIINLDELPFPDYEGFEYELVLDKKPQDVFAIDQGRLGYVSFGRSCPFNCTFCFHPSGTKYRKRSIESVFSEIDYLINKYKINNVVVTDELFVAKMSDLEEFCRRIKERNIGFIISLRVDLVNREMLQLLKDSGCLSIGFGLESADNSILKSMNKKITVEQIEKALSLCEEIGIFCQGNFIFGDQNETVETYTNTINWWKNHPQYTIPMQLIALYPGSELYKVGIKKGVIKDPVQFIKDGCPYVNVTKMTDQEYKDMALTIGMLPYGRIGEIHEAKIKYCGSGKADIIGNCAKCGSENVWDNLDVFRPLRTLICKKCNNSVNVLPCDFADKSIIEKNLEKIRGKKVAIWPMIGSVAEFCNFIPEDLIKDFYFIDKSEMKQGGRFLGNQVYSPSVIDKEKIEIVFVALTSLTSVGIIEDLQYNHPSVKHIYFLGDIIDKDFDLS